MQVPKYTIIRGFNGAGVFRPRKWLLPAALLDAPERLQWGRGLSTPEMVGGG